jgi:HK97 family phage major capsid protein
MAKLIKVSRTLIQHAPMAESAVRDEMIYRISIGAENAYMNGNGSSQPLGIFKASDDGIPTTRDVSTDNTATTVTFDGLQNAKYSLKQQYHANASWVMHRDLAKMLAKIKDGEGQYVWQGSVQNGQPDRLLGAPVYMSEYAPNTYTSDLYAAVFGDFKQGYWICDADAVAVQVLKELYAATNQIGYLFDYFGDGAPVLAEAFARVKMR